MRRLPSETYWSVCLWQQNRGSAASRSDLNLLKEGGWEEERRKEGKKERRKERKKEAKNIEECKGEIETPQQNIGIFAYSRPLTPQVSYENKRVRTLSYNWNSHLQEVWGDGRCVELGLVGCIPIDKVRRVLDPRDCSCATGEKNTGRNRRDEEILTK